MLSTYLVSEKAPLADPITDGLQARRHIEEYERYAQRIPHGSVGLSFHLTLDPSDLVRLSQSAVQRLYGEDADLDDEVFGGRMTQEMRRARDEDDEIFTGASEDVSTLYEEGDRPSISAAEKLRLERLQIVQSEVVLKKELQVQFGPKSVLDTLAIFGDVKMPKAAYPLLTTGADFVEGWKTAIVWCGGWPTPQNPNPFFPEDKALRDTFLANIQPRLLREEIKQKYCGSLNVMRKCFKEAYNKNYLVIRAAAAVSGVNDIFLGPASLRVSPSKTDVLTESSRAGPQRGKAGRYADGSLKPVRNLSVQGPKSAPAVFSEVPRSLDHVTCYLCEKKGHYQNNCPLANSSGQRNATSPVRPTNLNSTYAHANSPSKKDPPSVKFTSPVVSGKSSPPQWQKQSSPSGPPRDGQNSYKGKGQGYQSPSGGSKYQGGIVRGSVEEDRAHLAVRIGPPGRTPELQALAFADSGADENTMSRSWLPTLAAEGVVIQRVGPIEIRWTLEAPGRVLDEMVTLRVDFIGWARAPIDYEDNFLIVDQDMDWLTIGRAAMFRIRLSDDLRLIVAAQTALGVALSSGDLHHDPRFKDCDGNWVDSVDPFSFGETHEVCNVDSVGSLLAAILKISLSETMFSRSQKSDPVSKGNRMLRTRLSKCLSSRNEDGEYYSDASTEDNDAQLPSESESDCESEKSNAPVDGVIADGESSSSDEEDDAYGDVHDPEKAANSCPSSDSDYDDMPPLYSSDEDELVPLPVPVCRPVNAAKIERERLCQKREAAEKYRWWENRARGKQKALLVRSLLVKELPDSGSDSGSEDASSSSSEDGRMSKCARMTHANESDEDCSGLPRTVEYTQLFDHVGVMLVSPHPELESAVERFNEPAPLRRLPDRMRETAFGVNVSFFDRAVIQARVLLDEARDEAVAFMLSVQGEELRVVNFTPGHVEFAFNRYSQWVSLIGDVVEVHISVPIARLHRSAFEATLRETDDSFSLPDLENPASVEAVWARAQIYQIRTAIRTGVGQVFAYTPAVVSRTRHSTTRSGFLREETERIREDACLNCFNHGLAMVNGVCTLCIDTPNWWHNSFWRASSTDTLWLWRELCSRRNPVYSDDLAYDIPTFREDDPDPGSPGSSGQGPVRILAPVMRDMRRNNEGDSRSNGGSSPNGSKSKTGNTSAEEGLRDVIQNEALRDMEDFLVGSGVFVDALPPGGSKLPPMKIDFKENFVLPPLVGNRQYGERAMAALLAEVESQVAKGIIEQCSDAPVVAVVMVRKLDSPSGYRFCIDARPTNEGTIVYPYNPPTVDQVLRAMDRKPFKARFDMITSYWQVFIAEEDRYKTAFRVGGKVYRYIRMAMGLVQASSHLQKCLSWLFKDHIGFDMSIYIDDIVLFCTTLLELRELVRFVVLRLREHNIFLKRSKCVIGASELTLLGHVVGPDYICMAQSRVEEVANLPFPRNPKELRSSLGQLGYQRSYVPHYSELAAPLSNLVNGTTAAMQTDVARAAWKALLRAVADQVQLRFLSYDEAIVVRVDASVLGVGAILLNVSMEEGEKRERMVAVTSHAFTKAERLWKTIEQECFAVVVALRTWYGILWGQKFVVEGDHLNLSYIHQGSSPKVVRWDLFLQGFCYFYRHIPGESNVVPDRLSRQDFQGNHVLLADLESFDEEHSLATIEGEPSTNNEAARLIRTFTRSRPSQDARAKPPSPSIGKSIVDLTGDIVRQREEFTKVHNSLTGHHGINRTIRALYQAGIRWAKMSKDVTAMVAECVVCQKESARMASTGEVRTSLRQYSLFEEISIDFIGPLPEDALNNKYICEVICGFSNYVELFAVEAATSAVAAHVVISIVGRYGAPARIRSDRGTHFVNELIEELVRMLDMVHIVTPPYRPQANSMIERNGKETGRHLRAAVTIPEVRKVWSVVLPLVSRVSNKTYRDYLGCCPNDLVFVVPPALERGLEGVFEPERAVSELLPVSTEFMKVLVEANESLLDQATMILYERQKQLVGQTVQERNFGIGELVLLSYPTAPPSKLHARVAGPFRVTQIDRNLVTVQDITGTRVLQRDISMVVPFRVPAGMTEAQLVETAASDLDESVVVSISAVRGKPSKKQSLEFEVHWEDGEVSWEPYSTVSKLELLDEFLARSSDAKLRRLVSKPK